MSVHVGAYYLHKPNNGRGVLLGGVPGTLPGDVVIIGGGVVGTNAAKMAVGLGARVTILDTNLDRLRQLDDIFRGTRADAGLEPRAPRRSLPTRRPAHRRRADSRRLGAEARDARDGQRA